MSSSSQHPWLQTRGLWLQSPSPSIEPFPAAQAPPGPASPDSPGRCQVRPAAESGAQHREGRRQRCRLRAPTRGKSNQQDWEGLWAPSSEPGSGPGHRAVIVSQWKLPCSDDMQRNITGGKQDRKKQKEEWHSLQGGRVESRRDIGPDHPGHELPATCRFLPSTPLQQLCGPAPQGAPQTHEEQGPTHFSDLYPLACQASSKE